MTQAPAPKPMSQLIHAIHHNKAKYDSQWFGKGQAVILVEKKHQPDGTVKKSCSIQRDPKVVYHMTAPEHQAAQQHPELSVPIAKCEEYESPVDMLDLHVAKLTGQMALYNETRGPGANRRRRVMHGDRYLHGTDVNITDHYMDKYIEYFARQGTLNTTAPLDMAFADIEVDIIDHRGFPDEYDAPVPISLINYFHARTKTLRQFVLLNTVRENPAIFEFAQNEEYYKAMVYCEVNRAPLVKAKLVTEDDPWERVGELLGLGDGEANPDAVKLVRCEDVHFEFFETELDLILAFMHRVNEVDRPDVLAYWNMSFDINTQLGRLRRLGQDAEEVFTPQDMKAWAMAKYEKDNFNTEPTERNDVFTCTSYTVYLDQMLLYAQLRKQSGKKESYSLDSVLADELKEHKHRYEGSIKDFSYRDFPNFMVYGALDVVPMATLESKTEDIALAYQLSMTTRTRFHKIMKKTICLRNLAAVFYRERGLVLSNNRNRLKERTEGEKFRGAWNIYMGTLNFLNCWKLS